MSATPMVETRQRTVLIGFFLLALLAVLPIASVSLPPILDYPNHLARMHILAALPGTPELARFYRVVWTPVPNLALDAIVPWAARAVGVENAMRLFLALTLLGMAGGCLALHRVTFRRWSLWPLCAFLVLYNRMLLWGFLNYLAAFGLTLWALAAWIAMEHRPAVQRIGAGMVFATAIYLGHLAAFGCYALSIVALAAAPRDGEAFGIGTALRRAAPALVTLLPAGMLFLLSPTAGGSTEIAYGNILRKFDLPVSIFDNDNRVFDGATFGILLIAVIVGLVRGRITMNRRLRWAVIAVLVAFVVIPSRLLSAAGIDHRLPVAIAFLFVAAADWGKIEHRRAVMALLLVLLVARMAIIETVWLRADRVYTALRPAFDHIDTGASVAVAAPSRSVQAGGVPLLHFPTLAVTLKDGFVPTLFADPLQQPVVLTADATRRAAIAQPAELWSNIAAGHLPPLPGYNDLMIVDPPASLDRATLPGTILFDAPRLLLMRLTQPGAESNR